MIKLESSHELENDYVVEIYESTYTEEPYIINIKPPYSHMDALIVYVNTKYVCDFILEGVKDYIPYPEIHDNQTYYLLCDLVNFQKCLMPSLGNIFTLKTDMYNGRIKVPYMTFENVLTGDIIQVTNEAVSYITETDTDSFKSEYKPFINWFFRLAEIQRAPLKG